MAHRSLRQFKQKEMHASATSETGNRVNIVDGAAAWEPGGRCLYRENGSLNGFLSGLAITDRQGPFGEPG